MSKVLQMNTRKQSTIIVTAVIDSNGQEVFQEMPLEHDIDAPVSAIIGQAFAVVRQVGGLLIDSDKETMVYYPLLALRHVTFKYKDQRVALVTGLSASH